ncbi:MAG TPA: flavoprotein [Acidobacteriota bacterium]|nr:flavoprotein [Acidobacteriota bacterium]
MNIVLGITGSVAAVLTEKLCAALLATGHGVRIVATNPSLYFLPPGTGDPLKPAVPGRELATLELFHDKDEWLTSGYHKNDPVKHIEFRNWAHLLLIAPLSANTLAKMANGICDNFLCCIARAWPKEKPVVLAPAMNTEMWIDPITKEHIAALRKRFHKLTVLEPEYAVLACGDTGVGAMARIEHIVETMERYA